LITITLLLKTDIKASVFDEDLDLFSEILLFF